jgi:hypothetical protein
LYQCWFSTICLGKPSHCLVADLAEPDSKQVVGCITLDGPEAKKKSPDGESQKLLGPCVVKDEPKVMFC